MEKKGIGPQGLGVAGHNGFWIGSPAKQAKKYDGKLQYITQHKKKKK